MKKKNLQQNALFISLGIISFIFLSLSLIRQSSNQVAGRLGAANPSPPLTVALELLDNVPHHSSYQLTYPTLLPTHPLYLLKMIGDRLKLLVASSPTAKASLLLEYANTRMATAEILAKQGNIEPAISVATKGEIYLFQAIQIGPRLPKAQQVAWYETLKPIILKHEEVIERIHAVGTDTSRNQTSNLYQDLALYRTQIVALSGQPFGLLRPEDIPLESESIATPSAIVDQPSM